MGRRCFLIAVVASALLVAGCGSGHPRVRQEIVVHKIVVHGNQASGLSRKQLATFCRQVRSVDIPLPFCHVHGR
jgi:hypothetical protein